MNIKFLVEHNKINEKDDFQLCLQPILELTLPTELRMSILLETDPIIA